MMRGRRRALRFVPGILVLVGRLAGILSPQRALNGRHPPRVAPVSALRPGGGFLARPVLVIGLWPPAAVPKLVYNSILSWTNGWFFLVASEVFQVGSSKFARRGLGAFIADAGRNGDVASIAIGLAVLAAVVLALDFFVWRPLSVWSERFRMDTASGRELAKVPRYEPFRWMPRFPGVRRTILARARPATQAYHKASVRLDRAYASHPKVVRD